MSYARGAMYSPDKKMFICETEAQRDELAARGWHSLPQGYSPDEAAWIPSIPEKVQPKAKVEVKPPFDIQLRRPKG